MSSKNKLQQSKLNKIVYYVVIATKDSWRSQSTLFTTATVFAGICLLLLVLIGLKNGLVQRLHDNIMASWSSITGSWFAPSTTLALDSSAEKLLTDKMPPGTIFVPEITKIVSLSTEKSDVNSVTLQATVPGDPFLRFHGAEISKLESPELVISPSVARALSLDENSLPKNATISLSRSEGHHPATAQLQVVIRSIVGTNTNKEKIAYLSRYFMDQLEDFTQGEGVIQHGWPGQPINGSVGHHGYLAFAKQPYTADELNRLHMRGFRAKALETELQPTPLGSERTLHGLLRPHNLHVYFITSETQTDRLEQYLTFDTTEVENITTCDDVMLYWSKPLTAIVDGREHLLVGVTGSTRWLRGYFYDAHTKINGQEINQLILPQEETQKSNADLFLLNGDRLSLRRIETPSNIKRLFSSQLTESADAVTRFIDGLTNYVLFPLHRVNCEYDLLCIWQESLAREHLRKLDRLIGSMKQPIAVVPAGLLAALHRLKQGSLAFDPVNQEFQRINLPNQYFSGRFYARVLEDVPVIDDRLTQLGYSTVSNKLRVVEMQGYAGTLDLLVGILQAIAVALGVVTASVIFLEVTRRRQASIAIMRIVGMDSVGIFLFVFVRAILIAGLGWAIASLIAAIISIALPFLTNAECRLLVSDYIRVLAGAIACSVLGISFHAYAATKIPPLEGIKQGKVQ